MLAAPRKLLLELCLVVDEVRERVFDARREGGRDGAFDRRVAVLEEQRGKRRLEERGQDVPVARESVEILRRERLPVDGEPPVEAELPRDGRAARP